MGRHSLWQDRKGACRQGVYFLVYNLKWITGHLSATHQVSPGETCLLSLRIPGRYTRRYRAPRTLNNIVPLLLVASLRVSARTLILSPLLLANCSFLCVDIRVQTLPLLAATCQIRLSPWFLLIAMISVCLFLLVDVESTVSLSPCLLLDISIHVCIRVLTYTSLVASCYRPISVCSCMLVSAVSTCV